MAKRKKKSPEIDIKVRNLDTSCCSGKKMSWCGMSQNGGGHFWIFGSALAMVMSYERSASILWAILHGFLSWFYILFRSMQIWGWF